MQYDEWILRLFLSSFKEDMSQRFEENTPLSLSLITNYYTDVQILFVICF
jgi:hypothetical protein